MCRYNRREARRQTLLQSNKEGGPALKRPSLQALAFKNAVVPNEFVDTVLPENDRDGGMENLGWREVGSTVLLSLFYKHIILFDFFFVLLALEPTFSIAVDPSSAKRVKISTPKPASKQQISSRLPPTNFLPSNQFSKSNAQSDRHPSNSSIKVYYSDFIGHQAFLFPDSPFLDLFKGFYKRVLTFSCLYLHFVTSFFLKPFLLLFSSTQSKLKHPKPMVQANLQTNSNLPMSLLVTMIFLKDLFVMMILFLVYLTRDYKSHQSIFRALTKVCFSKKNSYFCYLNFMSNLPCNLYLYKTKYFFSFYFIIRCSCLLEENLIKNFIYSKKYFHFKKQLHKNFVSFSKKTFEQILLLMKKFSFLFKSFLHIIVFLAIPMIFF